MGRPNSEEQYARKSEYIKKFNKIYKDIPKDNKNKSTELIDKIASMSVTLEDYEKEIYTNGAVTEMEQGSYVIERESPHVKGYNNMIKSYKVIMDILDKMLPDAKESNINNAGEALAKFVAQGKPTGGGS
jgi:hypothetical protein